MSSSINPQFEAPEPTKLSRETVFKVAERVAKALGYSPESNLKTLVEGLGGRVEVKNFWAEGSNEGGSLEVVAEDDFTIYVPIDTSEIRDRFTIAHELGHYYLHYLWQTKVNDKPGFQLRASRYGSDRAEWEANWFASAFLMPSEEINKLKKDLSIGQISQHFRVSKQAAEIRCKTLEINEPT